MKRHAEAKGKQLSGTDVLRFRTALRVVLHVNESHVTTGDHVFTDDSQNP